MEEQQISLFVTSNAPTPLSDSESSMYPYPVEYAAPNYEASCVMPGVVNGMDSGVRTYVPTKVTFGFDLLKPRMLNLRLSNAHPLSSVVLIPSDVGKLNQLAIPNRFAIKHFPPIGGDEGDDVEVVFFDMSTKLWKFWYCYWSRSQPTFLPDNAFVKENCLKPKDMVSFSAYERTDGG
ncbi:hypothetical protein F511_43652 [Dorcoceras hygrometricum]|uniref:TF-B3 domain-containing protein n=1 Tax=Dorcoceras hygrometricum TaxID=472368 RepID=A0A2Z6ZYF7_9LAMI|nr:hypothetical protein F511_43652 [Dorcoceras hygrometricum]